MSVERTLWLWSTLPKKPLVVEDQTWRNEGDAVENVHRLQMGKTTRLSIIWKERIWTLDFWFPWLIDTDCSIMKLT